MRGNLARGPRDSGRIFTVDGGIFDAGCEIGSVDGGVAVVGVPLLQGDHAFSLIAHTVGRADGGEHHAKLLCHLSVVVDDEVDGLGVGVETGGQHPVDRQDDDCMRIGAVVTDEVHPFAHALAEVFVLYSWTIRLLLQDDVGPGLQLDHRFGRGLSL